MFVYGLLLEVISGIDFKIRSFTLINNSCYYGLDSSCIVVRSGLDDLNIYVYIACRWTSLL